MSNVPKSQRGLSELEFYNNALWIRKHLAFVLLRDFGVKDKIRNTTFIPKIPKISDEDVKTLQDLTEKYNISNPIIEQYPEWFIEDERKNIMYLARSLVWEITTANSIYPTSIYEYNIRRQHQNYAIADCEKLEQEFLFTIEVLPIDLNKYRDITAALDREIALLKGWRKSDNRLLKGIQKRLQNN